MSNIQKEKLKGNRIGVFFLTGAPLHLGHYQCIMQAKRENDGCVVVLCGYSGDRGDVIGLSLQKRFRYARELFADDKEIYVTSVDESDLPRYPEGWAPWLERTTNKAKQSILNADAELVWYVSEKDYEEELLDRLPKNMRVRLLDRSVLPISGTAIRENPFRYWHYITRPFRRHFSVNILVAGPASGGKSTLVRDLARSFGSPFTQEYARTYEEESNITDEELVASDFQYFASGQFDSNRKTIQSQANNGLFFADTNVTVTRMYSEAYLTPEEHAAFLPSYKHFEAQERWDLILIVPPVTPYVNDGFRDMRHSEDALRWQMHEKLLGLFEENGWGDKIRLLDAKTEDTIFDEQGFYARYVQARAIVAEHIEKTFGLAYTQQDQL